MMDKAILNFDVPTENLFHVMLLNANTQAFNVIFLPTQPKEVRPKANSNQASWLSLANVFSIWLSGN